MDKKEQAKHVNLVDFCILQGIPLIDQNTKNPKLEEHDSLVFFPDNVNGQWHRYSTQEGGDAIAFVEWYYKVDFKSAIDMLLDAKVKEIDPRRISTKHENKIFDYQKKYEVSDTNKISDYLVNERKVDKTIVQLFIELGLVKQDQRNNIIFKWIDDGKLVGANRQGTYKTKNGERSWKKTDANSTTNRGFNIKIGQPKTVRFFESTIDLMSYMSLYKDNIKDTWFISMEGLKNSLFEHYASKAIKEINGPPQVIYCIDNDKAGNEFSEKMVKMNSPYISVELPNNHKDWNDQLKDTVKQRTMKPMSHRANTATHAVEKKSSIVINNWQENLSRKKTGSYNDRER